MYIWQTSGWHVTCDCSVVGVWVVAKPIIDAHCVVDQIHLGKDKMYTIPAACYAVTEI